MQTVSIVGVGRIGGALTNALDGKGYKIENLIGRKKESKESVEKIAKRINPQPDILFSDDFTNVSSELIFITTQDFEIENVSNHLAETLRYKPFVFHTSGSLSSEILHALKKIGCPVASIHPLVSVSDPILGARRFKDAFFCVEGDDEAVEIARKIVSALEGRFFSIETKYKTLYHASAVTASGHLVALIDVALEMLTKCDLDKKNAQKILLPLIKSTVENLQTQTPSKALTGTFARADVATFEKHLEVLKQNVSVEAVQVYLQLANRSTHLAEVQGAAKKKIEEMQKKISLAKKNLKC